jgi:hypothetical protein
MLVLALPFRDFSIRILNAFTELSIQTVNSLSRWWFVMIIGLLAVWALRGLKKFMEDRAALRLSLVDLLLGFIVLLGGIEAFLSPVPSAGIASLRSYLQPLVVFILARSFLQSKRIKLKTLDSALMVVGVALFTVAAWQVLGWSEETYRKWGYLTQEGRLTGLPLNLGGGIYIRPASTVSGPNELGVLFSIFFFLALSWTFFGSNRVRPCTIFMSLAFLTGLALTFSRSAFLGFSAAVLVFGIYVFITSRKYFLSLEPHQRTRLVYSLLAVVAVIVAILGATGMFGYIGRTLQALSEEPHIQESLAALQFIPEHPAGVGMGMVSPKGALALMQVESKFHVEGSIFQIALEWGVWGLGLWLAFIGINLLRIWRAWNSVGMSDGQIFLGTAFTGWITALVAFIFLPLMQSINLMVLLWFLLGVGAGLAGTGSREIRS